MENNGEVNKILFHDSFQHMGSRVHIIEDNVPVEHQIEYLVYSYFFRGNRRKKLKEKDYKRCLEQLENVEISVAEKKKILSMLAFSCEIRAYRLLEQYAQNPDEKLVHWASMALIESRMAIESELSDEKQIYISTGLGGKGEKLRLYALLLSALKKPFADYQKKVIEKEFDYFLSENDCEIERLTIRDRYVELVFLLPVATDMRKMLDTAILECNQYGNFLAKKYTLTNVKELSQDEINQVLKSYRKQHNKTFDRLE